MRASNCGPSDIGVPGRSVSTIVLISLLASVLLAFAAGCDDDDPPISPPELRGRVLDAAGAPVADAAIGLVYYPSLRAHAGAAPRAKGDVPIPPPVFELQQNFPNPFEGVTAIRLNLPIRAFVQAEIFDFRGEPVRRLTDSELAAGVHEFLWDALDDQGVAVPNGVYTARFTAQREPEPFVGELVMLLHEPEATFACSAPLVTTDADGRFSIRLRDSPVGQPIEFTDENGESLGSVDVPNVVIVCACDTQGGTACMYTKLGALARDIDVEIQLAP